MHACGRRAFGRGKTRYDIGLEDDLTAFDIPHMLLRNRNLRVGIAPVLIGMCTRCRRVCGFFLNRLAVLDMRL